ncbi:hypothetical protein [Methylotenera sp.]|uniref:hypothetical protein n=1 Tax=Methylotenera sp. TaxID=2051956 RepID=UPI0024890687|nr:hypothetical protein [Methylotenera sp.]MDI1298140.1 hypothetical protein [Methylotenera sp.]
MFAGKPISFNQPLIVSSAWSTLRGMPLFLAKFRISGFIVIAALRLLCQFLAFTRFFASSFNG